MNDLLTRLGVPGRVQAFFDVDDLLFSYGEHFEHFDSSFHRVPTTPNIWLAGKGFSNNVIITSSAMEAIAYLTVNGYRHPKLDLLSFAAVGNLPGAGQIHWLRTNFPKKKFTLIFGNDLLGKLADIKVAAGLKKRVVRLVRSDRLIVITLDKKSYCFDPETLSLHAFEKVSGLRTGARTSKPKEFNSYLDQLKYDATQRNSD